MASKYIEHFGFLGEVEINNCPEGAYVIRKYRPGTRLLELVFIDNNSHNHIGTIDIVDIVFVSNKHRLKDMSKEDFYYTLKNIFSIDLKGKLYVTPEAMVIIEQLASKVVKQPYVSKKYHIEDPF